MKIKRCGDCGRFLGINSFNWENKKKGHLKSYCKRCNSNRKYLWTLDNKDHYHEYQKQYNSDNKEHRNEKSKQHYQDNPEYYKQYCKDNKEHRNECSKQYQKDNLDKCAAISAKRYAVKRNQSPKLTETEKKRVYYLYKFSNILGKYFQVDHYQPINKGGLHHPDNLQILTRDLNKEKSDKWPLTEEEKIKYEGFRI